jgi:hypothetical protein
VLRENLISGNAFDGVRLNEGVSASLVRDNRIGTKAFAFCAPLPCTADGALGNGGNGISMAGASATIASGNTIAWNGGAGVRVSGTGSIDNYVSTNRLYDNAGLGIDLGVEGPDPIDNDASSATAPNRGLNRPLLESARGGLRSGSVGGRLQSTNGAYLVEVYASDLSDPSAFGEGRDLIGTTSVAIGNATPGGNGLVVFDVPVQWTSSLLGRSISAVVIDARGNTSEFSQSRGWQLIDVIFEDGFDGSR